MFNLKFLTKGMMLVSVIMLMVLLVMLTTSMIFIASRTLNIMGKSDRNSIALQTAEAGLEYARFQLSNDIDWGKTMTSDIVMNLGNEQESTIIFNPSEHRTINNLDGNSQLVTAPPYTAEVICKGIYKEGGKIKQKVYLRGVFSRDDEYPCPVYSGGYIAIDGGSPSPYYKFTGNESNPSPVRIHSNDRLSIANADVDLSEGFVSSGSTVDLLNVNTIMTKTDALPVRIPVIDIAKIVNDRMASCLSLIDNTFYLAGYFEYDPKNPYDSSDPNGRRYRYDPSDPNARRDPNDPNWPYNPNDDPDDANDDPNSSYCIPHSSSSSISSDPTVHNSHKLGIVSFSENSATNFLNNYGDFYYNPPAGGPGGENRDFFKYYSAIKFWEYNSDPNSSFQEVEDQLGMTMSKSSFNTITLKLDKDIYVPGNTGLFETDWIGLAKDKPGGVDIAPSVYYPDSMDTIMKLDFANHKIYGNKLWLGIAPCGTGGIISKKTIDFIHSYNDLKMIALSEESVNMAYREPGRQSGASLTYRGIIYAKDDIVIQPNSKERRIDDFKFYGTMLCRDANPDNCTGSPLGCFPLLINNERNVSIEASTLDNLLIVHTSDGREPLINLRGKDYTIKKLFTEELQIIN
jgi:hypothetical protein